jgi:hypothetical protein
VIPVGKETGKTDVGLDVTLKWEAMPGAEKYYVYINYGIGLPDSKIMEGITPVEVVDTSYSPPGLLADKTYYWRVVPWNSNGHGLSSQNSSFDTIQNPATKSSGGCLGP